MIKPSLLLLLLVVSNPLFADYYVDGEITAGECSGVVIKICQSGIVVSAFEKGGKLYEMPEKFSSVDEFNKPSGKCSIQISKSSMWTPTDAATRAAIFPNFYRKNEHGKLEKFSPDYLSFNCYKR